MASKMTRLTSSCTTSMFVEIDASMRDALAEPRPYSSVDDDLSFQAGGSGLAGQTIAINGNRSTIAFERTLWH